MVSNIHSFGLIAVTCLFVTVSASAQAPRWGGDGGRGGWSRPERPTQFTAEDRERFYDRMIEGYMERLTRTYELDEQQQAAARAQLEDIRVEQRAYAEPRMQELESIRAEFRTMRESGQFDRERARELGERLRGTFQEAPLMNREHVVAEVEKLLPPHQVQRGRAQREAQEGEWQQRREEMRRRWEERRQQEAAGQAEQDPQAQQDRDARRQRWQDRRTEERGGRDGRAGERGAQDRRERFEQWRQQARQQQTQRPPVDDPTGSWERYVRDFVRWYNLDASQHATAQSVLRTMRENRSNYERANGEEFQAARNMADRTARQQRLDSLNEPVVRMFGELKSQLERIPSAAQRDAIRSSGATTEPATDSGEQTTNRRDPQREREAGERREGRDRGPRTRGRR